MRAKTCRIFAHQSDSNTSAWCVRSNAHFDVKWSAECTKFGLKCCSKFEFCAIGVHSTNIRNFLKFACFFMNFEYSEAYHDVKWCVSSFASNDLIFQSPEGAHTEVATAKRAQRAKRSRAEVSSFTTHAHSCFDSNMRSGHLIQLMILLVQCRICKANQPNFESRSAAQASVYSITSYDIILTMWRATCYSGKARVHRRRWNSRLDDRRDLRHKVEDCDSQIWDRCKVLKNIQGCRWVTEQADEISTSHGMNMSEYIDDDKRTLEPWRNGGQGQKFRSFWKFANICFDSVRTPFFSWSSSKYCVFSMYNWN